MIITKSTRQPKNVERLRAWLARGEEYRAKRAREAARDAIVAYCAWDTYAAPPPPRSPVDRLKPPR